MFLKNRIKTHDTTGIIEKRVKCLIYATKIDNSTFTFSDKKVKKEEKTNSADLITVGLFIMLSFNLSL